MIDRMNSVRRLSLILAFMVMSLWNAAPLCAAEAWLVRFHNVGGRIGQCHQAIWTNDVLLYNRNADPVVVRLLDISGTLDPRTNRTLTLPPQRVVSLERAPAPTGYWSPSAPANQLVWVLHLEVPEGVVIESRNEV